MQMSHTILVLSIFFGTYVIPPDYMLYRTSTTKSNTTVVLDGGEHLISKICTISFIHNVTIMGSSIKNTTILCTEGSELQFFAVQHLTIEKMTFINCGIILTMTEKYSYHNLHISELLTIPLLIPLVVQ